MAGLHKDDVIEWDSEPAKASAVSAPPVAAPSAAPVDAGKPNQQRIIEKVGGPLNTPILNATDNEKNKDQSVTDRIVNAYSLLPAPVQYGAPASAALTAGVAGYKYYKSQQGEGINPEKPSVMSGLKARFFGQGSNNAPIDYSKEPSMGVSAEEAAQTQAEKDWRAKLSPTDQALLRRAEDAVAAKNAPAPNEPYMAPEAPVSTETQTPEQIRLAKQAVATQALEQKLSAPVVDLPPANQPAPNVAESAPKLDPKIHALLQPASTAAAPAAAPALPPQGAAPQPVAPVANVAPEPVPTVPVEPVATPAAEPVATTPTPAATDAERVQAIQTTEEPATKTTSEKIKETVTTPKETPKEEFVPRKWPGTSKGGAGAEGFALQQLGASRATYSKEHAAALEILKDRTNGILTQSPSGGGIHQQDQLSKMYEDYTGEPIPKTEKGGWARIPDSQVAELHAGILNELQEAAKGGKLKSLGKGALSAAALLGISEAVQAAQKGNFGPLKEAGFDIGIGALGGPAVMAGQMAMTGQTLASGMTPKGQKEFQNRQEILSRPGVQEQLKYLNVLNPNLSKEDFNKRVDAYLATNPNAPKSKLQQFNEQTRQQQINQTQKEHSLRK